MDIIDFNKERYEENKKVANDLLRLIHLLDSDTIPMKKDVVIEQLRRIEFKCRTKMFEYQKKLK